MPRLAVYPEQDRVLPLIAGRPGLEQRRHLPRVERVHAAVVLAGREQNRRVLHTGLDAVVGRVRVEDRELLRLGGRRPTMGILNTQSEPPA